MPDPGFEITGLKDIDKMLNDAPALIAATGLLRGLEAAAEVMKEAVAARTPERSEGERPEDQKHLIDALESTIEIDSRRHGGRAQVGFGKLGYLARWVEYGHELLGHEPGKKHIGHVPAHPFMRPAFESTKDAALDAFTKELGASLKSNPIGAKVAK